jgi:hypothetical protein
MSRRAGAAEAYRLAAAEARRRAEESASLASSDRSGLHYGAEKAARELATWCEEMAKSCT